MADKVLDYMGRIGIALGIAIILLTSAVVIITAALGPFALIGWIFSKFFDYLGGTSCSLP